VEPPGGKSGNIEHTWVCTISLQAAVHPLTGPHTNKKQTNSKHVTDKEVKADYIRKINLRIFFFFVSLSYEHKNPLMYDVSVVIYVSDVK
jgi:hypothetical protein